MTSVHYDFSAMCFSSTHVGISVTTNCVLAPPPTEQIKTTWDDILNCFASGGWHQVAHILGALPYTCNALGVFAVGGPNRRRQEVFRLLTPHRIKATEAQFSLSVRFSRELARLDRLTIHHWMGCARSVEDDTFVLPLPNMDLWSEAIPV